MFNFMYLLSFLMPLGAYKLLTPSLHLPVNPVFSCQFFALETRRLAMSFESLNISLAQRWQMDNFFDPRAEFATSWPLEGQIQCDLHNHNVCKNRLL